MGFVLVGVREGGKCVEQSGRLAEGGAVQAGLPVFEQSVEVVPQSGEFDQAGLRRRELGLGDCAHLATRSAAFVAFAKDHGQLREGEPEGERATDQMNASEGAVRILTIVVRRTARLREHTCSFVVTQTVGADPGLAGQRS